MTYNRMQSNRLESFAALDNMEKMVFRRGEKLMAEGDYGDRAYIICAGEVEVYKRSKTGQNILVSRLGVGGMVGESCLLELRAKRTATVTAFTDKVEAYQINQQEFIEEFLELSPMLKLVLQSLFHRLNLNNKRI